MKNTLKRFISCIMTVLLLCGALAGTVMADGEDGDVIVLYTNDVHCGVEGYATLAAYRAQLIADGHSVVTVDAGDAIQGEMIGSLTDGSAIIDIMNTVGYDIAVPGNHEFDYGMEAFLSLAQDEAEFDYISANFVDLKTDNCVFEPYKIVKMNGIDVAFVGIATPETYTKSTPVYFQDENGNYIYSFCENELYSVVQSAIDGAVAEGADCVIAVGHMGITGTADGWKSTDIIANTEGIDAFLDAHSHEYIESAVYQNKNGEDVVLSSTKTKLEYFGELTISDDKNISARLVPVESIDVDSMGADANAAYDAVKAKIDGYNDELSYLYDVLGTTEVELTLNDAESGEWVIRLAETNMGDFVADAYRSVTGADIALVNGGGIRAAIPEGDVTRKSLMDVNPWNNEMCVVSATGSQILDALEMGASLLPETSGGFLQVSGIAFEIHSWRESPVLKDDRSSFIGIDEGKVRRVENVTVGGEPIDPEKTYTLAGSYYMLKDGGDGFTMFKDCEIVKKEGLPSDAQMLIQYFCSTLGCRVTEEQYGDLKGSGRITVISEEPVAEDDENVSSDENKNENSSPETKDNVVFIAPILVLALSAIVIVCRKKKSI